MSCAAVLQEIAVRVPGEDTLPVLRGEAIGGIMGVRRHQRRGDRPGLHGAVAHHVIAIGKGVGVCARIVRARQPIQRVVGVSDRRGDDSRRGRPGCDGDVVGLRDGILLRGRKRGQRGGEDAGRRVDVNRIGDCAGVPIAKIPQVGRDRFRRRRLIREGHR